MTPIEADSVEVDSIEDLARTGLPRWFEVLLAAGGLLLVSPLLAAAALAVKLSSPGPILFRQRRVGRHGRPFVLLKFRSMRQGDGLAITAAGDQRITPAGRWLRKSKVDELPELWNVLLGEMSFVGPRPEVPRYVDLDDPLWRRVLTVAPGLTDPVTLELRNEEALLATVDGDADAFYRHVLLPYKLAGNARYLARRTAATDLALILATVVGVLRPSRRPPPDCQQIRQAVGGRSSPSTTDDPATDEGIAAAGRPLDGGKIGQ